jgi:hypothetical protein
VRIDSPSARLCSACCVGFALWTVSTHLVVARGGSLRDLTLVFPGLSLGAGAGLLLARRFRRSSPGGGAEPGRPAPSDPAPDAGRMRAARAAGLLAGLAALARYAVRRDAVELWWLAVAVLGAASLLTRSAARAPQAAPGEGARGGEGALFALGAACALLALFWHRPDLDDAFYVNIAVAAADHPDRPLFQHDSMRGIAGLPFSAAYLAQSWELLNGAFSHLLGIPALYCFHWLSAAGAALLVPLATARLVRALLPDRWLFATAATLALLLAAGDTHRGYGNLSLVRIWQGKAVFLCVALPLVQAYALHFARRPGAGAFGLLAAAQIASVGLTSTALWAAPLAAGLALLAGATPDARGLRRAALGTLASAYVLAAALLLRSRVPAALAAGDAGAAPGRELAGMLSSVLGGGPFQLVGLAAVLLAWTALRPGLAQRFATVVPLGVLLLVANPYLEGFVRENLAGFAQWRVMWLLPIPLLIGFLCRAPLELGAPRIPIRARHAASAALLALFACAAPQHTALRAPWQHLGWPRLKVEPVGFAWALRVRAAVPAGASVLAPPAVNAWLPTLHRHPFPLEIRPDYHYDLPPEEATPRFALTRYVAGELRVEGAPELLREGIGRYRIAAVCLLRSAWSAEIRGVLEQSGFERARGDTAFELWLPARAPGPAPRG